MALLNIVSGRIETDADKSQSVSFTPEDVDVDWIISETDEYGNWTDRNSL